MRRFHPAAAAHAISSRVPDPRPPAGAVGRLAEGRTGFPATPRAPCRAPSPPLTRRPADRRCRPRRGACRRHTGRHEAEWREAGWHEAAWLGAGWLGPGLADAPGSRRREGEVPRGRGDPAMA